VTIGEFGSRKWSISRSQGDRSNDRGLRAADIRALSADVPSVAEATVAVDPSSSRIGSISHIRGVGSNDRDVSTADLRASTLTVPFVA
jgi:hypothetical protein